MNDRPVEPSLDARTLHSIQERIRSGSVSRRQLMRYAMVGGGAALAAPWLAACGDNTSSGSTSGSSSGAKAAGGAVSADVVSKIRQYVGPIDDATSGKGMTIKVGNVLALSGPGSYYGGVMTKGSDLGVKHVKAAGGPDFSMVYKDHKSGDPQAGVTAARDLGGSGTQIMLSSYNADLFAMLPGIAQYKIFTLDGGGGTSDAGKGKPFFYGTRAITPDDTFPGVVRYIKDNLPDVKKVASCGWDLGANDDPIEANLRKALTGNGLELAHWEVTPVGATDYSTALSHIQSSNPDLVLIFLYGLDPGYFMKQYVTSGIGKPVIGAEFTPDAAKTAGSAYNKYMFSYDFFNVSQPTNDWGKLFVEEFRKGYGADPDFYAANFYENVFKLWDLTRRVLKAGGKPTSGPALEQALLTDLSFKSVYGGSGATPGITALDKTTHSVSKRPMGVFRYESKKVTALAYFDINGADYRAA